jgi:hypothetical protein
VIAREDTSLAAQHLIAAALLDRLVSIVFVSVLVFNF